MRIVACLLEHCANLPPLDRLHVSLLAGHILDSDLATRSRWHLPRRTWGGGRTEGPSFSSCGVDGVVTRTLDRVIQGFREAIGSHNSMALNGLVSEAMRSLAQDLDACSRASSPPAGMRLSAACADDPRGQDNLPLTRFHVR